jgi:hypothetical protein
MFVRAPSSFSLLNLRIFQTHYKVGVDCEMCNTAEGLEITRATFVSSHGTVLYDSLVCVHTKLNQLPRKVLINA